MLTAERLDYLFLVYWMMRSGYIAMFGSGRKIKGSARAWFEAGYLGLEEELIIFGD